MYFIRYYVKKILIVHKVLDEKPPFAIFLLFLAKLDNEDKFLLAFFLAPMFGEKLIGPRKCCTKF